MKILYYDCFSGISGDMNLGALLDLGVDKEYLIKELEKLKVSGYEIVVTTDERKGITGTKVNVKLDSEEEVEHKHSSHAHADHVHHNHVHDEHRNLMDIEKIINSSSLNDEVKKLSMNIFLKVAEAEAKIHGKGIMEVHFHEVGAVDSIVDIIGAAICLDYLKVDKVICSSVEVGGGFVNCAHGRFPVPAPATTEILKGIPIKLGAVPFETTTPTGAAILAATVNEFTDKKQFTVSRVGYGIGHRDTEIPNVLRVFIGEVKEDSQSNLSYVPYNKEVSVDYNKEGANVIECNIDDMNPETYDYIMEKLFNMGVMDVYLTPIIMKKGRPGITISVLCGDEIEESVISFILKETTTLGIRKYKVRRTILKRENSIIHMEYGSVRVKTSFYNEEKIKAKPEYEDIKKIAIEKNLPISKVYEAAWKRIID